MTIGWYIFCGFLVVMGLVGFVAQLNKISNDGKKSLLDEMFKNNDISADVYKKYKKL